MQEQRKNHIKTLIGNLVSEQFESMTTEEYNEFTSVLNILRKRLNN